MGAVRDQLTEVVSRAFRVVAEGTRIANDSGTCRGVWGSGFGADTDACKAVLARFVTLQTQVVALQKRVMALDENGGAPAKAEAKRIVDTAYVFEAEASQALRGDFQSTDLGVFQNFCAALLEAIKAAAKAVAQATFEVAKAVVGGVFDGATASLLGDWRGLVVAYLLFKAYQHHRSS